MTSFWMLPHDVHVAPIVVSTGHLGIEKNFLIKLSDGLLELFLTDQFHASLEVARGILQFGGFNSRAV